MARDPAVLFYTSDFISGTELFTYEQKGQYIHLLCTQHQSGHLPESYMIKILQTKDNPVWDKFVQDEKGFYYQKRMDKETIRRRNFTESRKSNLMGTHKADHMETGTITDNITTTIKETAKKWNDFAELNGLAKIVKLTDKRTKKLQKRLTDENFNIDNILTRISESDFLLGKSKDWKVDFDFIIENETNYIKILEGKYSGRANSKDGARPDELAKISTERAIRNKV